MDKSKIEQILNSLEGISLSEWQKLKNCIDRDFSSQSNKLKLTSNDILQGNLDLELI